ncbi:hypothetical protein SERPOUNCE_17 [Bacillus phage SerPounce]|uniref:Uncharacterized protein n=1 Tax=Bacillus phage SerPounce TaxID=1983413 RepID=A0A1X9SHE0_9CAUD|nr:hypothetical protein H3011_gp17 [Bacillus phage SerPounce]ARQ95552.1 hypothetical protein SERPOUNCE_17 [Bacillus phage SerPounce]
MKPFEIQNKYHKLSVIERVKRDLRALVMYELEDADEEGFNISSKAYKDLFGKDATEGFWEEKREYLDKINEKRKSYVKNSNYFN